MNEIIANMQNVRLIIRTKCVTKEDINHGHRHNAHNIESRYFIRVIAQLAAVIGFNKKLHPSGTKG